MTFRPPVASAPLEKFEWILDITGTKDSLFPVILTISSLSFGRFRISQDFEEYNYWEFMQFWNFFN